MDFQEVLTRFFPNNIPTLQQKAAFTAIADFLRQRADTCFILRGYAGTGKTTIIAALIQALPMLKMRSVLLAPTGRAAKVMQTYAHKPATTIHKKIYRKHTAGTPDLVFSLAENLHKHTLFIVDEASMISNEKTDMNGTNLLEDLINYVYEGEDCSLLFVGDTAQLPPVGLEESPALQPKYLEDRFGFKTIWQELTDVVRQEKDTGILYNATRIREQIHLDQSHTASAMKFPKLKVSGYTDVYRMTGERLVEGLDYAYHKYGMANTLVICRSNKHANQYNQQIRNRILYREEEITGGDYIMVVRNNYYWAAQQDWESTFIANGDMAIVKRVRNVHEQFGFRFADVNLSFLDQEGAEPLSCRVLLDTLYTDSPNLPYTDQKRLFEAVMSDYAHIPNKRERLAAMRSDPYYNALQIKFAMAVTCHKAQGGQWDAVFVDQGFITEEMLNNDFLKWLYTACTRATKELFLVNFHEKFYL